jgi:hypothetical protein
LQYGRNLVIRGKLSRLNLTLDEFVDLNPSGDTGLPLKLLITHTDKLGRGYLPNQDVPCLACYSTVYYYPSHGFHFSSGKDDLLSN